MCSFSNRCQVKANEDSLCVKKIDVSIFDQISLKHLERLGIVTYAVLWKNTSS